MAADNDLEFVTKRTKALIRGIRKFQEEPYAPSSQASQIVYSYLRDRDSLPAEIRDLPEKARPGALALQGHSDHYLNDSDTGLAVQYVMRCKEFWASVLASLPADKDPVTDRIFGVVLSRRIKDLENALLNEHPVKDVLMNVQAIRSEYVFPGGQVRIHDIVDAIDAGRQMARMVYQKIESPRENGLCARLSMISKCMGGMKKLANAADRDYRIRIGKQDIYGKKERIIESLRGIIVNEALCLEKSADWARYRKVMLEAGSYVAESIRKKDAYVSKCLLRITDELLQDRSYHAAAGRLTAEIKQFVDSQIEEYGGQHARLLATAGCMQAMQEPLVSHMNKVFFGRPEFEIDRLLLSYHAAAHRMGISPSMLPLYEPAKSISNELRLLPIRRKGSPQPI